MCCQSHELNNWTCGTIHQNRQGRRLPECRQCRNCGKWIGYEELDSECPAKHDIVKQRKE